MTFPKYISRNSPISDSISMWQPHQPTFELCLPIHATSCRHTSLIHPKQQTLSTCPWVPRTSAWERYFSNWLLYTDMPHEEGIEYALHYMKLNANTLPPGAPSPNTIGVLLETILKKNNVSFMGRHFLQLSSTAMVTKAFPTYINLFLGHHDEIIRKAFIWAISFWEEIHRRHLRDLPRHYQTTPIHERFHDQPPTHDQIHFSTLQPIVILPRHADPHRSGLRTLNNPVQ